MKLISIIMPCYNAEKVIDRTIETLVNQTFGIENMELIFVDDASTDSTLDKLCAWEKKYPESVLVIHCDENGRQGRARNIGLSYASGKYIGFMDNDDMVRLDMYERMLAQAEKYHADLVIGNSGTLSMEEFERLNLSASSDDDSLYFEINDVEARRKFIEQDYNIAIWNKIYRRDMIVENRLCFLEGMIYDDIYFSGLMKQCPSRVVVMREKFYYHILTGKNVSYGNRDKTLVFGYIEAQLELINELQNRGQYEAFATWYRDDFIISYASFVKSYCLQFGYIELGLWNSLKMHIFKLIPDILQSHVLKVNFKNKSMGIIFDSLRGNIDKSYVLKLMSALMDERIGAE